MPLTSLDLLDLFRIHTGFQNLDKLGHALGIDDFEETGTAGQRDSTVSA